MHFTLNKHIPILKMTGPVMFPCCSMLVVLGKASMDIYTNIFVFTFVSPRKEPARCGIFFG